MNFEKAYENYKNGTATDEEKAYVEGEIDKARKLTELIDKQDAERCAIVEASVEEVKKAKKEHTVKSVLRTAVIGIVLLIIAVGVICASVFGTAVTAAKKSVKFTMAEAEAMAKNYVASQSAAIADNLIVTEKDRDLKIEKVLKHSYYYYSFDMQNGTAGEIDVYVNAHTGEVSFVDFDKN